MKKVHRPSRAFSKIRAGLQDAIAYHKGARKLTVRDVTSSRRRPWARGRLWKCARGSGSPRRPSRESST